MTDISLLFLIGLFTPGLIRGAFWYDSPAVEGVLWVFVTIGIVVSIGWITGKIFGNGFVPTVAMIGTIAFANMYAVRGALFSLQNNRERDIDGKDE